MEWLIILALGVWVWLQTRRSDALARRIEALEALIAHIQREPRPEPDRKGELLLTEVAPADELLLDTPLPEASNDTGHQEDLAPAPRPELVLSEPLPEPDGAPPPAPKPPSLRFDQWLAERGLAWIGGGAFALGAAYMVSVAAQQNWFTPPVRLACALFLGAALLGVSEWTRRANLKHPPGHPLLSAMLAGAGVVAFYAVVWAAHGLYGFVNAPWTAALLIICAVLLAALSSLHGQALGILAIAMALLAPAITTEPKWSSFALTLFICVVSASGLALAALRRWAWAAAAALAGLYFWFFEALALNEIQRALIFLSIASLAALALTLRRPLEEKAAARFDWRHIHSVGPSVAIAVSSAMTIWAWLALAPAGTVLAPALAAIYHVGLSAYAVRARVALQPALLIAIGALVAGFAGYLRARFFFGAPAPDFYPTILLSAVAVTLAALAARPRPPERMLTALAGALGVAALSAMAAVSRTDWHSLSAWSALLGGALLSFTAAWRLQRTAPPADASISWWAGAGAALVLLGIESALPMPFRALGHGAAALAFAAGLHWRGWRILNTAALTAAAFALGHAVAPDFVDAALSDTNPIWRAVAVVAMAAGCLFGASRFAKRSAGGATTHEALSSAGIIALLAAGFIGLRWIAAGGAGVSIDTLTENALRAVALLAAGHTLAPRARHDAGVIGAWRGHALLILGLAYTLVVLGVFLNPWWGASPAQVQGVSLLNALTLAFVAPAAIAIAAARRHHAALPMLARCYAAAGAALALVWVMLQLRHAFHGASMSADVIGLFEAACYPLAGLLIAVIVTVFAHARAAKKPGAADSRDLMGASSAISWAALVCAAVLMLFAFHPIWGRHDADASNELSTLLATLGQGAAAALALTLATMLARLAFANAARLAAAAGSVLFALSFGHAMVRWFHHRAFMDDAAPPLGLEGLAHALWPLAFVLASIWLTRALAVRLGPSMLERDVNAIGAIAIWPALCFAALGLWFIFNPWWGLEPVRFYTAAGAGMTFAAYLAAAGLSYVAGIAPNVWRKDVFAGAAVVACTAHLFVAATLAARWLYHSDDLIRARVGETELWAYSAVWAGFGAVALALGVVKKSAVLRWIGLAILLATTAKVFIVDTSRLSGVIRAASVIGLGAMLMAATWAARRYGPKPDPGELITVTPSNGPKKRQVRNRARTSTDQPS